MHMMSALPLDKVERARGRELDKTLEHNVKTDAARAQREDRHHLGSRQEGWAEDREVQVGRWMEASAR